LAFGAAVNDVMLMSVFRNEVNLHGFIKHLFQRNIVTLADLPPSPEHLADEFELDVVSREIFLEKIRKAACRFQTGGARIVQFQPRS
jgi:hypothetical protein